LSRRGRTLGFTGEKGNVARGGKRVSGSKKDRKPYLNAREEDSKSHQFARIAAEKRKEVQGEKSSIKE